MFATSRIQGLYISKLSCFIYVDWEIAFKPTLASGVAGKLAALWDCCTLSAFTYTGNELLAITAWETENPRYSLPKSVRRVSRRIVLYYTLAALFLGLTVSSEDPILKLPGDGSPNYPGAFIIMAERAGLPAVAHIINAVMVLAAFSVATVDIYVVVRVAIALF